jgi:hypothetical protein
LRQEDEFFERLNNALRNILITRYENLYAGAQDVFHRFRSATAAKVRIASKELFVARVAASEQTHEFPEEADERGLAYLVLPKIVEDSTEIDIMEKITGWLAKEFPLDAA